MIKHLVFCEECRKDVQYTIQDEIMTGKLKGLRYEYTGKAAHCDKCGGEVYVSELHDINSKTLYSVYREKNGLISLEKILQIPQKYGIGKRPLSLLLGWGEQTFSRYCDGMIPAKEYSEILEKIYEDNHYYNCILESKKENLKTMAAYEKSKRAVEVLMGIKNDTKSKINLVSGYLLHQCEDITPFALQKALYYIQGFYYAFHKEYLFCEDCETSYYGPVYKDYKSVAKDKVIDSSIFSSKEKSIFDSVINNFCCYSGKVLKEFIFMETPWLESHGDLLHNLNSSYVIKKELIGSYFMQVKEKYNMVIPADMKDYAKNMFEQIIGVII